MDFCEEIGVPIQLPQPNVINGGMRLTKTSEWGGTKVGETAVLETESSSYYELGRVLKVAQYGQVCHSFALTKGDDGKFYRCDPLVHRAIKVYSKAKLRKVAHMSQEQPLNEISAMQLIHHPNVLSPLECCHDSDYIYLIMEYCSGGELFDAVLDNTRLDETTAKQYFQQIILGLQYFHNTHSLAHRDMVSLHIIYIS